MDEILLVLVGALLAVTAGAAVEYYKQLRRVNKEYEKARDVIGDVVLSFNRELKREAERLELVAYKVEAVSARDEGFMNRLDGLGKQLHDLEDKMRTTLEDREKLSARLNEIDNQLRDAVASQEGLKVKITGIEEQAKKFSIPPEANIETVIPIKREKALAPLTETELAALEMLASEGPKTAPEIKEKIKLSREHTARLMKKLYEEGYLERDTSKIPFRYRVKEEMGKLLKKTESETA